MAKRPSPAAMPISFKTRLLEKGTFSDRVLKAFDQVARREFLDERYSDYADDDIAIPLPCGQTQTAPSALARMIHALDVGPGDRVLEIGTGSGYATALLAHLALSVTSLERFRNLADSAKRRLARPSLGTIAVWHADGSRGYAEEAPYDRIIIHAAIETEPSALIEQLTPGGAVVAVLRVGSVAELTRWKRSLAGRAIEIDHFGRLDLPLMAHGLSEAL